MKKTNQESFYTQMVYFLGLAAHTKYMDLTELTKLVESYAPFTKIQGDNDRWRDFYPKYLANCWRPWIKLSVRKDLVPSDFKKSIDRIHQMAWACQLEATPEGDEILKKIWEECGRIAAILLAE